MIYNIQRLLIALTGDVCASSIYAQTSTMTDPRDGKTYDITTIGDQIWMAENLAFTVNTGNQWAYNNDEMNLDKYSYLYDWETAQNVCPSGWHLPSSDEWRRLINFWHQEKKSALKRGAKIPWGYKNGTFKVQEGGSFSPASKFTGPQFLAAGRHGRWWTATEDSDITAWFVDIDYGFVGVNRSQLKKRSGMSVRCVKNQ